MPPSYFPLRWESTGDQWWFASPIDWAAANGHYDLVRELLYLDTNLLIKLTSLCRIRRLESVWDDEEQFQDVAKCRSQVAQKLLLECETKKGHNSLIRAGYGGWLLYTAASAGDLEFVKRLLEKDPFLVFGEGEYGVSDMLYAAARSKNCEVFKLLLDSSISPRSVGSDGMEEKEVQPEEVQSVFKWDMMNRAVHAAARGGDVKMLKQLLGDCPDVLVYRDALGSTLLHSASGKGQAEVVKFLLESYDVVNTKDHQGNTALHIAAYRGYLSTVHILVDSSPSTALVKNNFGDTFLHMTVAGFKGPGFRRLDRQIELIKQLVCGKVVNMEDIINAKNNDGRTALHMAVMDNIQSELVELLMSSRFINLNVRDVDGNTPLDILRHKPKSASSDILIKQLISAGGISKCQDLMSRNALVSHLKLHGIGGSPGTSFRIPDAEIFLYTGIDGAFDAGIDFSCTDYDTCSGELSYSGSSIGSSSQKKKLSSVSNAARRVKMLLHLTSKKEKQNIQRALKDDKSIEPYNLEDEDSIEPYPRVGKTPISLRHKFSTPPALPHNKRVVALPHSLPSPSTKKNYASKLMQGVLQVKRQLSFASPSSTLSESSWSSPTSVDREKGLDLGNKNTGRLGSILSPNRNKMKSFNRKQGGSFNIRLMNQCFSFGAQGLASGSLNNIG